MVQNQYENIHRIAHKLGETKMSHTLLPLT